MEEEPSERGQSAVAHKYPTPYSPLKFCEMCSNTCFLFLESSSEEQVALELLGCHPQNPLSASWRQEKDPERPNTAVEQAA